MAYTVMILAPRKAGVTHEIFKSRYERHMRMAADLAGDTAPLSHTRLYPQYDSSTEQPLLLAGSADDMPYSVAVLMDFEDEEAFHKFTAALTTPDADAKIKEDEAGFWNRERMKVMVVDRFGS